jgi:hypothetical protein
LGLINEKAKAYQAVVGGTKLETISFKQKRFWVIRTEKIEF